MTDAQLKKFLQELYRHFNAQAKACQVLLSAIEEGQPKMVYNTDNGDGVTTTPALEYEE